MSNAFDFEMVDTLRSIGQAVVVLHTFEGVLRLNMTIVFQKGGGDMTPEKLLHQEAAEAEKTIGYFLSQLRYRVDVSPDLETRLSALLDARNKLFHRPHEIPGYTLSTPEGQAIIRSFADHVASEAYEMMMLFAGMLVAWGKQTGLPVRPEHGDIVSKLEEHYAPLAVQGLIPKNKDIT